VSLAQARLNRDWFGASEWRYRNAVRPPTPKEWPSYYRDWTVEKARHAWGYGKFIRAMDDAFHFVVTEFGYEPAEAGIHHEDLLVSYRNAACRLMVQLAAPDTVSADLRVVLWRPPTEGPADQPAVHLIWDILAARDPNTDWYAWPRQQHLTEDEVNRILTLWADGTRRLAGDYLQNCELETLTD
jgi:hypothetical protein